MALCEVGKPAPVFTLQSIGPDETAPRQVSLNEYAGRWLVLIFYPRDFSFVCPTELTSFSAHLSDFEARDCELLGISVDSVDMHQEWLTTPPSEGGLGRLRFPLAADPDGTAARAYGVWVAEKEVSARGLFVIDPEGVLQYLVMHNLSVGRRPDVVLRVLDALQTGGLCPANWTSADGTIDPEKVLHPGRVLGRYRIRERLGSGTFGSVFSAWDLRLDRIVALKVLKRSLFESRAAVLEEARAAAALNSPNVCTIYSVDEEDGLPVIAMEYLDGKSLSEAVGEGLDRGTALDLAQQVALGLAAAHEAGVVHGDLKPANVIVTSQGIAKIVDFGLARASRLNDEDHDSDAIAEPSSTELGDGASSTEQLDATIAYTSARQDASLQASQRHATIRGTPAYMSPEQANAIPATPASDVYSFGMVLHEMLTGRPAHGERPILETLLKVQSVDLGPGLALQVEEPFREALLTMLSRNAAQRPTMAEVLRLLDALGADR